MSLEVSAENDFFKQARADAQEHKESGLKIGVRRHGAKNAHGIVDRFLHVVEIDSAEGDADAEEQQ